MPGSENGTPLITHVDFIYLPTKDFAAAKKFFVDVLGLEQSKNYGKMPGGEFETGNLTLQILEPDKFGMEFQASTSPIAFQVEDVEAARETLEAEGIEFLGETMDSGVCHMAPFKDRDGNVLMLHHRYAPEGARPEGLAN